MHAASWTPLSAGRLTWPSFDTGAAPDDLRFGLGCLTRRRKPPADFSKGARPTLFSQRFKPKHS